MKFSEKLQSAQARNRTAVALVIAPRMVEMPMPIQKFDDPFFPFSKAIIAATRDVVCAYMFDLACYLAHGAAGAVALERSIAYVGGDVPTILHAPFASPAYVEAAGVNAFNVDGVTIAEPDYAAAYAKVFERGVFVVPQEGALRVALCSVAERDVPRLVSEVAAALSVS